MSSRPHVPKSRIPAGPRAGVSPAAAFTLIELVFVMVLLGLLSSVALPRLSSLFGINLRTSATEVSGYLRNAYEQAVMRHERVRVRLDFAKGTYWAETWTEAPAVPLLDENSKVDEALTAFRDRADAPQPTLEERAEALQALYKKVEGGTLKPARLSGGIRFKALHLGDGRPVEEGVPAVEFSPNGFAPKTVLYVTNEREDVYTVIVAPLGGRSRVEKGEVRPGDA